MTDNQLGNNLNNNQPQPTTSQPIAGPTPASSGFGNSSALPQSTAQPVVNSSPSPLSSLAGGSSFGQKSANQAGLDDIFSETDNGSSMTGMSDLPIDGSQELMGVEVVEEVQGVSRIKKIATVLTVLVLVAGVLAGLLFLGKFFKKSKVVDGNKDQMPIAASSTAGDMESSVPDSQTSSVKEETATSSVSGTLDEATSSQMINEASTTPEDIGSDTAGGSVPAEVKDKPDPATIDTDGDGLNDAREMELGLDPKDVDTDKDGLYDKEEVEKYKTDPKNADTDGDGQSDGYEVSNMKNPNGTGDLIKLPGGEIGVDEKNDTDNDGLTDKEEADYGTDPNKADTDDDGLTDYYETKVYNTDPKNKDSDGDTYLDGEEVQHGYNPKGSGKLLK